MAEKKYTVDQVAGALREGNGILSVAAKILGCHRNTIYNYLEDHPELKDIVEECRETDQSHRKAKSQSQARVNAEFPRYPVTPVQYPQLWVLKHRYG